MTKFWKILVLVCVGFVVFTGIFLMTEVDQMNNNLNYIAESDSNISSDANKISDQLSMMGGQLNDATTLLGYNRNFLNLLNQDLTTGSYYAGLPWNTPKPK
jgi:uncharacterized membrane protein